MNPDSSFISVNPVIIDWQAAHPLMRFLSRSKTTPATAPAEGTSAATVPADGPAPRAASSAQCRSPP